jgi:hypothetical protein
LYHKIQLKRWFRSFTSGTAAPTKHEALFWFWKQGPAFLGFVLQLLLFCQAIFLAVYLTSGIPNRHLKAAELDADGKFGEAALAEYFTIFMQMLPHFLSLIFLWPEVLRKYAICCNTGMMKDEHIIEDVAHKIEQEQFKQ